MHYYCPLLEGNPPTWVYFSCGIALFVYQTLDNLDGKQARRTKTSSPIGELLDHGCDSLVLPFLSISNSYILGLSPTYSLINFVGAVIPFFFAHWEEYYVDELILGMFSGPTEGLMGVVLLYIITFFAGPTFWYTEVHIGDYTFLIYQFLAFGFLSSALTNFASGFLNGLKHANRKKISFFQHFQHWFSFISAFICWSIWVGTSYEYYEKHYHLFLMSFGFVFSYITCSMIVQRICNEPLSNFYWIVIFTWAGSANALIGLLTQVYIVAPDTMLIIVWIAGFLQMSHFSVSVALDMAKALNVTLFTVPTNKKKN